MRGTLSIRGVLRYARGIIPAYAGNTSAVDNVVELVGDHPRVCGEHLLLFSNLTSFLGSSPRMRGTLDYHHVDIDHGGIIPAYAGNTLRFSRSVSPYRDHPRVCGEHIEYKVEGATSQGSSPRMRGTPIALATFVIACGIIPAYAGNTLRLRIMFSSTRDHPRVCGEH